MRLATSKLIFTTDKNKACKRLVKIDMVSITFSFKGLDKESTLETAIASRRSSLAADSGKRVSIYA